MIYNNANFIAIPFETLIKNFKDKFANDGSLKTVDDFRDKFKEYLKTEPDKNNIPMVSFYDKINIFENLMAGELDDLIKTQLKNGLWIVKS